MDLPEGLRPRYRSLGRLGAGGFGTVLRCHDQQLDRAVAIKLLDQGTGDLSWQARFQREARVTAGLEHPGIVRVFDHGSEAGGRAFIVYELIEGPDLATAVAATGPPDPDTATRWALELGEALGAVHAAGLVHRDVKPENVMVRPGGALVLVDFGIVRAPEGLTVRTAAGLILGTPAYLAPEVWRGQEHGPAADQFAWAATLVRVLTGRGVYPGDDPQEIVGALAGWTPDRALATLEAAGSPLSPVLRRALQPTAAARFPTMNQALQALRDPASTRPGATRLAPPAPPVPALREPGPVPPRLARGLWGLALLVALGIGWGVRSGEPRAPTTPREPPPASPAPRDLEARTRPLRDRARKLWEALGASPTPEQDWPAEWSLAREEAIERAAHPTTLRRWHEFLDAYQQVLVDLETHGGLDAAAAELPWLRAGESLEGSLGTGLRVHLRVLGLGVSDLHGVASEDWNSLEDLLEAAQDNFPALRKQVHATVARIRSRVPAGSETLRFHLAALELLATPLPGSGVAGARAREVPYGPPVTPQANLLLTYWLLSFLTETRLAHEITCQDRTEVLEALGGNLAGFTGSFDRFHLASRGLSALLELPSGCAVPDLEGAATTWIELASSGLPVPPSTLPTLHGQLARTLARLPEGSPMRPRVADLQGALLRLPADSPEGLIEHLLAAERSLREALGGSPGAAPWSLALPEDPMRLLQGAAGHDAAFSLTHLCDVLAILVPCLERMPAAQRARLAPWLYPGEALVTFLDQALRAMARGSRGSSLFQIRSGTPEVMLSIQRAGRQLEKVRARLRRFESELRAALPAPSAPAEALGEAVATWNATPTW